VTKRLEGEFWKRVEKTDGCWLWTGTIDKGGYGILSGGINVKIRAHRFSYVLHVGAIPSGLALDHLCRVRNCVNPKHLEPVTIGENVRRGITPLVNKQRGEIKRAARFCKNGHEYEDGSFYYDDFGTKICRVCGRERMRKHRAKKVMPGQLKMDVST
jgi:hypothetical protein